MTLSLLVELKFRRFWAAMHRDKQPQVRVLLLCNGAILEGAITKRK